MEIQQSDEYASYIRRLGWVVERPDSHYLFIKPFPIIGGIAKLQRCDTLPEAERLMFLLKKYRVRTLAVEPDSTLAQKDLSLWIRTMKRAVNINTDYFLPTKTIRVSLKESEEAIFARFTEAKRRAVRRAEKLGIEIAHSRDITTFIRLKSTTAGTFGGITTHGMDKLWECMPEKQSYILTAHEKKDPDKKPIAGVLCLIHNRVAYYWLAGATKHAKKLYAPTHVVWYALKEAKKRGCREFDFVGVWDERMKTMHLDWKGFTKFKEGFGGYPVYYPLSQ